MTNDRDHQEGEDASTRDRRVPKLLLSYDEATWSMGVCERTLRNMVAKGELAAIKIGGRALFDPVDLQAVINTHRVSKADTRSDAGPKSVQSQ